MPFDKKEFSKSMDSKTKKLTKDDFHRLIRSYENSPRRVAGLFSWMSIMPPELKSVICAKGYELYEQAKSIGVEGVTPAVLCDFIAMSIEIAKRWHDNQPLLPKTDLETMGYKERLIYMNIGKVETLIMGAEGKWSWGAVYKAFIPLVHDQLVGHDKLKRNPTEIMTPAYFLRIAKKYLFTEGTRDAREITKADITKLAAEQLAKQREQFPDVSRPMRRKG